MISLTRLPKYPQPLPYIRRALAKIVFDLKMNYYCVVIISVGSPGAPIFGHTNTKLSVEKLMKVRLGVVRWKAGPHGSRDQVIIIN